MELGALDCAAKSWLRRLRDAEQTEVVPIKEVESLRKLHKAELRRIQEATKKDRRIRKEAEGALQREKALGVWAKRQAEDAQAAMQDAQKLLVDAQVSAASARTDAEHARCTLADETRRREAAEEDARRSWAHVSELHALIRDDRALQVMADFAAKLDSQRVELLRLRRSLDASGDTEVRLHGALAESQQKLQHIRQERDDGRTMAVQANIERDVALADLRKLAEAGKELQLAAEQAAKERDAARQEAAELVEAGADLQAQAQGVMDLLDIGAPFGAEGLVSPLYDGTAYPSWAPETGVPDFQVGAGPDPQSDEP